MTHILFWGCFYSDNQKLQFLNSSKRGYQSAAQNFQEALVDGLSQNGIDFSVASIPSLGTFPLSNKLLVVIDDVHAFHGNVIGKSFGYINLPIVNNIHQPRIDNYIENWYYNNPGEKCILVYALLRQQMQYAVAAKQRHPDIKLSIIIPDLPVFMACNKYYRMLGLQKRDMVVIDRLINEFDSFILLAEPMKEYLHIDAKPYIIVEGIYRDAQLGQYVEEKKNNTILYSGSIQSRYGVFDLVEAFLRLSNPEYRCILCGPCPEMDKLNKYLIQDNRISYKGLLPTDQVRLLQKQVSLLVNPRHSTEEFTKYSFPSKTIEYMASGTPVLMSPLPSMPDEYKEYLYLFNDESIDGMKTKLEATLNIEPEILKAKGKSASEYILKNKNSKVQVSRIIELLKNV